MPELIKKYITKIIFCTEILDLLRMPLHGQTQLLAIYLNAKRIRL